MPRFTLASLCLAALISVAHSQKAYQRPVNADCVSPDSVTAASAGNTQYFPRDFQTAGLAIVDSPDLVKIDSAIGFDVTYSGNVKIANNSIAGEVYVLYQCGTPTPNPKDYPQGAKIVQIPLTAAVVPDTTAFAFLSALAVEDRITNVTELAVGACGQRLAECSRTVDSLLDSSNSSAMLAAFGPYSDALLSTLPTSVPFGIAINAPMDPGPLNRAEWIKFVSLFFNKEPEANKYFDSVKERYNDIKETVEEAVTMSKFKSPLVAWVSYQSTFPPAAYQISLAEYKNTLTKDAGGRVLNRSEVVGSGAEPSLFSPLLLEFTWGANQTFESQEEAQLAVYELLKDVDVIIDETYAVDAAAYNLTTFLAGYGFNRSATPLDNSVRWWNNTSILRFDAIQNENSGLDWFESAVVNPHKVLSQLAAYLYPRMQANPPSGYFRNIAIDEDVVVLTSESCKAVNKACTVEPMPICPYVQLCSNGAVAQRQQIKNNTCVYSQCS